MSLTVDPTFKRAVLRDANKPLSLNHSLTLQLELQRDAPFYWPVDVILTVGSQWSGNRFVTEKSVLSGLQSEE